MQKEKKKVFFFLKFPIPEDSNLQRLVIKISNNDMKE